MTQQQIQCLYKGYVLEITPFGVDARLYSSMIYLVTKATMEEAIGAIHAQIGVALQPLE